MSEAAISRDQRNTRAKPAVLLVDIIIVVAVSGLAFVLEDLVRGLIELSPESRGVSGVLAGAITAVVLVLARGGTLADLGFRRPERWSVVPLQVGAILIAFLAAQALAPMFISLFVAVPEPDFSQYAAYTGNLGAAIGLALILPLTASIPEEIIYRGFLMGRLSDIFGRTTRGAVLTVLIQAIAFGSVHFQWGIGGMIMTFMMGIVWGTAYLLCGRNLWVVILAHSAGHILFVTGLYLGRSLF